ncbi:hypothetical protein BVG19_g1456 [[Candida] boidinii]|nr:hypothetical protein BVG19_g1456 [[Candida] boidinii]OWB54087.1 hypothetical protein B5S27_g5716 [[Candida] boidinii]
MSETVGDTKPISIAPATLKNIQKNEEPVKKRLKLTKSSTTNASPPNSATSTPEPSSLKPGTNTKADVLQRRREGRQRAMEKLQSKLDELGIRRTEQENELPFTTIPSISLINQKNYFTDYLKKDDQIMMLRDSKEKLLPKPSKEPSSSTNLKQDASVNAGDILKKLKNGDYNDLSTGANTPIPGTSTPTPGPTAEGNDEENEEDIKIGSRTIVLHPGSSNIRIGLATDVDPKIVPNVIALKKPFFTKEDDESETPELNFDPKREIDDDGVMHFFDDSFIKSRKQIVSNFKERMRYYKRRILPSSNEQCINFNKRQVSESIQDHNDPHKIEYLDSKSLYFDKSVQYLVGEEALRLDSYKNWFLRSPFTNGQFNDLDINYRSQQELLNDVEILLSNILTKQLNIDLKKIDQYSIVLIIPNLYNKRYVETMIHFLLNTLNFNNVAIIQEGVSATFGSGISSACVVDIGSATTKISCVEDGSVIQNSPVELSYGGDDITRFFIKNLLHSQFPYKEISLNNVYDLKLSNELKEKFITFEDANIAVQMYNFQVRNPGKLAQKFEFKIFDEVMISPMGLFYPDIFNETETVNNNIIHDDKGNETLKGDKNSVVRGIKNPPKYVRVNGLFDSEFHDEDDENYSDPVSKSNENEIKNQWITKMDTVSALEHLISLDEDSKNSNDDSNTGTGSGRGRHKNSSNNNINNNNNNDDDEANTSIYDDEENDKDNSKNRRIANLKDNQEIIEINNEKLILNSNKISNIKYNMTPLDLAIIESITYSSFTDSSRMSRLYSNILLVGGSSTITGLDSILVDRLHIWRSKLIGNNKLDEVIKLVNSFKSEYDSNKQALFNKYKDEMNKYNNAVNHANSASSATPAATTAATASGTGTAVGTPAPSAEAEADNQSIVIPPKPKKPVIDPFKLSKSQLNQINELVDSGSTLPIEILSSSRDIEPSLLIWKGGSVYARLKIVNELWVNSEQWDKLGSRCLNYATLFNY